MALAPMIHRQPTHTELLEVAEHVREMREEAQRYGMESFSSPLKAVSLKGGA